MVYDFACLTKSYSDMGESTRSMSSSDAEFEIEDRPALIRNKKRFDGLSTSLRGRPRSTGRDVMSISLRDRPRSTSATRRIAAAIGKLKEKDKSEEVAVDIGVELLDDDDDDDVLRANEKTYKKNENSRQNPVQITTGTESNNTNRPQILRAPSFAAVEPPSDIISEVAEKSTKKPNKEITSSPGKSKRIWSQRLGKQTNDSVPIISEAPASPSPHKSPPRSPRRPSILANAKIPSLDIFTKDVHSNEQLPVPESPSTKTHRPISPMKVFGQRAMGGIMRSRKKSSDDNPATLEVEEGFSKTTTNTNPVAPISPTKRAIAGILRACSLHDRSSFPEKIGTKTGSVHERTMPSSLRKSKNAGSQRNSDDQRAKADDDDKNAAKLNADELTLGETEMPSNSERGTRSSARVVDIDNESTYSRAVKSLVSPHQSAKRRLRATTIRDPEKLVKSGIARNKRQSQRGNSSPKQTRRLSNGNSVTSRRDELSQGTNTTSRGRTRSQSRTRRLSSHGSSGDMDIDENVAIHRDSVSRRTTGSSRRNPSTPRTSRASKSGERDGTKSVSRTSSSRKVSELQIPFPDDTITPKSKKSAVPTDILQGTSELHVTTVDEPTSPDSGKSEDQENSKEAIKRSGSSRRIAREGSNHESLPKRSNARRSASSVNTEQVRTPRVNRSEEMDGTKSMLRPRSRPNPSDVQMPFTDDASKALPSKSETQTTSDKNKTRGSSSRRGTSEQHSPLVDDPKSITRSGSRRNVSDIKVPAREVPKSPRSRRSGVSVSSNKEIYRRSRSTCPGSSKRTSVKRVSSARIGSALEINASSRDEEKSLATERSNSSRTVKCSGSRGSKVTGKSPGRISAEEGEAW